MAKKNLTPAYTTIWGYTASGINWIFDQDDWKADRFEKKYPYCISEGIKLMMIISMASVIEGALRSFLRAKINDAKNRKEALEEYFKNEDTNSSSEDLSDSSVVEVDALPFMPDDDLREEYEDHVALLKRSAYAQKVKGMKKWYFGLKNALNDILSKRNLSLTQVEYERLEDVLNSIEGSAWRDLQSFYDKINVTTIKESLKTHNPNLLRDVNMLFSFRNFVVHGKRIDIKFDVVATKVVYDNDAKILVDYLKEKKFYSSSVQNKYIIEGLLPDEVIRAC